MEEGSLRWTFITYPLRFTWHFPNLVHVPRNQNVNSFAAIQKLLNMRLVASSLSWSKLVASRSSTYLGWCSRRTIGIQKTKPLPLDRCCANQQYRIESIRKEITSGRCQNYKIDWTFCGITSENMVCLIERDATILTIISLTRLQTFDGTIKNGSRCLNFLSYGCRHYPN